MRPRFMRPLVAILLLCTLIPAQAAPPNDKPLAGFDRESAERERALEARFDSLLRKDDLREWMKRLAARPHHVGSAYDRENAEFLLGLYRSWGFDAQIESFDVLFPTPKTRLLELTAPEKYTARLAEPPLKEDSTSNQTSEQLPTYNAYSIDGDVTGQLVYVNYGVPRDYDELERRGIDVKGKIVIARYGGSWRGIKPKVAAEHGAVACIIYSDPRDDGYFEGDVYPKGAYRNEWGAQRGSVADMPLYPGDPLTPGVGATKEAKRLDIKTAPTLTKIPVLPISYGDAEPLLRALGGPVAPASWRGALPVTYHLGPGPATVHLKLEFNWDIKPVNDVVARLKGGDLADEWIVRGNHHDAWVNGADDPISGQVAMLEEARALGELARTGWKPRRTIIYCSWDGEEPGLLGSTEWVETHAAELQRHAVVYVNSDSNGRGFLEASGSHTLEKFMNEVARDVVDPEKKISVGDRLRARRILDGDADERREARERADLRLAALGSGSDYTAFIDHLGVASLNLGYGGEDGGGSYHSIYDSFDHYTRFVDPTFDYGVALSQTAGRVVLRFADADTLPLSFADFTDTVGRYVKEVSKLAEDTREEIAEKNRRIGDGTFRAVFDPTETYVAPNREAPAPYLNFAPLQNALARLQESAKNYQTAFASPAAQERLRSRATQARLDEILRGVEHSMTNDAGLPRRPWFKHQIYAPGFYTGYGVKTLPGVREAVEQHNWREADEEVTVVSKTIEQVAAEIDRATALLQGGR
ncbi:MAG TPA: transferrin receptor-like dimerization domain-containing protein [Pyrinomonadaceae bacterium]|jgi:N-acetylated-alpha-linked acidic dipeptidase|nr:transferrin receptor-like dimerization domain-containing protein [Pyrinomonadaceae bacterium]